MGDAKLTSQSGIYTERLVSRFLKQSAILGVSVQIHRVGYNMCFVSKFAPWTVWRVVGGLDNTGMSVVARQHVTAAKS